MKHALVTGASGFIGLELCRRLRGQGVRVRAQMRRARAAPGPWDEVVSADLAEGSLPAACLEGVDSLFHLAGKVHALSERMDDEEEYRRVNVDGTRLLLEAARRAGCRRFVFLSSVQAMGETASARLDEGSEPHPATAYGRSKLAAEALVLDPALSPPHACCLRPPLVYGPGQKGNLQRMIRAVDQGLFPPLPETGNRRSMVHVQDVVDAAVLAAAHPGARGRTYIVTDGRAYSSREILDAIRGSLRRRVPRWHVPLGALRFLARAGDVVGRLRGRRFVFDSDALEKLIGSAWYSSERISRELGFRASRGFLEALPEIIADYKGGRGAGGPLR